MKRFFILLSSIVILLSFCMQVYALTFSDLAESHWAYKQIMMLANEGIINGYENGTYKPEKAVTRGEFLKLIMTALYGGTEYFEKNNFNLGHWATPYAIEAARAGCLMNGTTITGLDNEISRKEMVHILAKICINNRIEREKQTESIDFLDVVSLDQNSKLYIDFVVRNGLINGYPEGVFKPDKTMTRAEVATVMSRFLELQG